LKRLCRRSWRGEVSWRGARPKSESGLDVWFKGGTSLSKRFGLIERFSEDLDLKLDPGTASLPRVADWKSEGAKAVRDRLAYFILLPSVVAVPGPPRH
jgi:hypothetical protein